MDNQHLHSTVHSTNHNGIKRIFLIVATTAILWFVPPCQAKPKEVQLRCESPKFAFVADNPFSALATAVTRNKKAARFRVTWSAVLFSGWNDGTMLYDRKRSLLKYYDTGGQGYGAWFYRKSYLFTGVKDTTLIDITDTYDNEQGIEKIYPTAFIHLLPKLGYRRYKLIDMQRWDASKK